MITSPTYGHGAGDLVLRLDHIDHLDAREIHAVAAAVREAKREGRAVLAVGVRPHLAFLLGLVGVKNLQELSA